MATKKKTVSELNKIVENLEEKVKHLEEEVKNMKKLEVKLKHLEENIKIFKSHSNKESESLGSKKLQESVKCRKCDCNFKTTKLLRDHMKSNHMSVIKCNACDITFDAHWKLEKHLSKEHNKEKTFDCEVCDQSFYTNWRLKKHTQSHDEHDIKYCHYFNNSKKCPYEEFGCKFRHAKSDQCKYQKNCRNKLCQYRHQQDPSSDKATENIEDEETFDLYVKTNFPKIFDYYLNNNRYVPCYFCKYSSKSQSLKTIEVEMTKHLETKHEDILAAFDPVNSGYEDWIHEEYLQFFCPE